MPYLDKLCKEFDKETSNKYYYQPTPIVLANIDRFAGSENSMLLLSLVC